MKGNHNSFLYFELFLLVTDLPATKKENIPRKEILHCHVGSCTLIIKHEDYYIQ